MNSLYTQIYNASKHLHDPDLRRKLHCLLRGMKLQNVELACRQFGACRSTYYNWLHRLEQADFSPEALFDRSCRPHSHPHTISGELREQILSMREEFHYGPARLAWYMKKLGFSVSPNGVYKVLKRAQVAFRKRRGKKPNPHTRRYVLDRPGQGFQLDIKYVPFPLENQKAYVFSAIDDCTRWRFSYAYLCLGPGPALDFVRKLVAAAPFSIEKIQTDNDVAFTDRFRNLSPDHSWTHPFPELLATLKILHQLIPPGIKELNGKIERLHGTDDQEFYWKLPRSISFPNFNRELERWNFDYNHHRPHSSLAMRTPIERLSDFGILPRATYRQLKSLEHQARLREIDHQLATPSWVVAKVHSLPPKPKRRSLSLQDWAFYLSRPLPPLCKMCGNTTFNEALGASSDRIF
ncbi:MAG TPA: IS481 family transposase [Bdellovibrionota bacterium]|nr:IS481 family transposase [Bdellovibrionota bacterium]